MRNVRRAAITTRKQADEAAGLGFVPETTAEQIIELCNEAIAMADGDLDGEPAERVGLARQMLTD